MARQDEKSTSILAGENLRELQQKDPELGAIVNFRLASSEVPDDEVLQTESELTKRMITKWNELEVHDGLVYRRYSKVKGSEPDYLQLLLPRAEVDEAIRHCHAGMVGGHFAIKKTLRQVQRRFYWSTWKEDTKRFCRRCEECAKYHRGKIPKHGPLKPVLPGAPYERWYIDLTAVHIRSLIEVIFGS